MFRGSPFPENPFPISFCLEFLLQSAVKTIGCIACVMILVSAHSQILRFHMQYERTLKALVSSSFSLAKSTIFLCFQIHRICRRNDGTTGFTIRSDHQINWFESVRAKPSESLLKTSFKNRFPECSEVEPD